MLQKFWPLLLLILVGLLALMVLDPWGGGKKEGTALTPLDELEKDDLVLGSGKEAKPGDTVEVHYVGRVRSTGQEFDASRRRGEPFRFTLGMGQVIQGWDQGVAGMKEGGKRKLAIPARLAYGGQPPPGSGIPPHADLVFEVELLSVR